MANPLLPRYPLYIPSKGRADVCLTARFLMNDRVPFFLVIEPQEYEVYSMHFGAEKLLVLPENNQGLIYARNWIKGHATQAGYSRHWQLDDNICEIWRWYQGKRIPCQGGIALAVVEDFVDRYENVAVAGLNYEMFGTGKTPPFRLNCHVYSCSLILNSLSNRWRSVYNDDTDYCLQVLSDGWCTVQVNVFLIKKMRTMLVKGGNTDNLYQGDGRLKMARALERLWPGVVQVKRRFKRPQHVINWKKFDTPLKLKPGLIIDPTPNEYGMELVQVKPVKSEALRQLLTEHQSKKAEAKS